MSDPVALSAMFNTYREAYDLPSWNSECVSFLVLRSPECLGRTITEGVCRDLPATSCLVMHSAVVSQPVTRRSSHPQCTFLNQYHPELGHNARTDNGLQCPTSRKAIMYRLADGCSGSIRRSTPSWPEACIPPCVHTCRVTRHFCRLQVDLGVTYSRTGATQLAEARRGGQRDRLVRRYCRVLGHKSPRIDDNPRPTHQTMAAAAEHAPERWVGASQNVPAGCLHIARRTTNFHSRSAHISYLTSSPARCDLYSGLA